MVKALLVAVAVACCGSLSAQSPSPGTPDEACVMELHRPVRHVCGVIDTGEQGGVRQPVRNAILTLMQDGKLVAREETHDKASFDFMEKLNDGSYDLMVESANQTATRFRILVHKPIQKCGKGLLWITMPLHTECGHIVYWVWKPL